MGGRGRRAPQGGKGQPGPSSENTEEESGWVHLLFACHSTQPFYARLGQLRLLQSLVPATQGRQGVEEVEVLEETTRYIQTLEQKLMDRLREQGLPARLAKLRQDEEGELREDGDEGDNEGLLGLVHRTLGNEVAERVGVQQEEDKREEERLVREGVGRADAVVSRGRRSQGGGEEGGRDDERGEAEGRGDWQSS